MLRWERGIGERICGGTLALNTDGVPPFSKKPSLGSLEMIMPRSAGRVIYCDGTHWWMVRSVLIDREMDEHFD